ncbi:MAG: leucine-rich repeat domain-containing protein [Acutalibacteraceae bacterium]
MKKLKQAVSYVLVFLTVFSSFTILPSEFFHSAAVYAADLLTGQSGAKETYTEGDFTYSLINDYMEVEIVSYNGSSTDVVIPDVATGSEIAAIAGKKVTSIANRVFYNKGLTSVTFGKNITSIGNYAFYNNTALTEIDLSVCTGLITIGDYAFKNNDALTTLTLPDSLQTIGYQAFYNCDKLTAVETGSNLTSIGSHAFYDCNNLTTVNIKGGNNTTINEYAFYDCNGLESVTIGDGVKAINNNAFTGCELLKTVTIGSGSTSVSSTAFEGDTALESITVSADNTGLSSVDGILFNKDKTAILLYPKSRSGAYTIPILLQQ